jgi:UDP-glucose 4-epimerase
MVKNMKNTILVTGGLGYIGSHTCVELLLEDFKVVIVDNLCNSSIIALDRIELITGKKPTFIEGDVRDRSLLVDVFSKHKIASVIHFAGLKSVAESVRNPISYYDTNVSGTLILADVMAEFKCRNIVFSSSATVYGEPKELPIKESFKVGAINPYGSSKLMSERILSDLYKSDTNWSVGLLRYFNPVGAHKSGLIGEDPNDSPNNLMPIISQVAVKRREKLLIFGNDYPTKDGTGIRDYLHVSDLADAHVKAIKKTLQSNDLFILNLGTGQGYSVFDIIKAFENISNVKIPYEIVERRAGDVAQCFADPTMAKKVLNWNTSRSLNEMCEDVWRWQSKNPSGYRID